MMRRALGIILAALFFASPVGAQTVAQGRGSTSSPWMITFGGTAQPVTVGNTVPVTFTMPPLVAGAALIGHVIVDSGSINLSGSVDTELPAAAALSDATANPTTPMIGAALMTWNSVNWVRAPTSAGNALLVMNGIQLGAGIANVSAPSSIGDTTSANNGPPAYAYFYNPASTVWNRARTVDPTSGGNTAGGGIHAAGILGMFDDVAPTAITENNFGNLRMSANRNLYSVIRDAAGNERGANVTAGGALQVDGSGAIQPVSGTVTTSPPANASTNIAQVGGTATDTNSGLKSAGTIRVVLATDQPALSNKILVTPDSVALPANQSVNVNQFGGSAVATGTGTSGAGVPRVTVANDSNVIVTPPTLTKATQGATGFSTQDLHDAGRTAINFYANNVASGTTTTETLITLTQSKGTGATSSATTYTITSGKRLRITAISVASRGNATATIQSTVFNLRLNTAGACVVTSTPILMGMQSATAAVASAWDRVIIPIPEGYEIAGDGTAAICISAAATFTTNAPTWSVNLIGYEY